MSPDITCGEAGCGKLAVGFIGKFGETRTVGSPVNTPPGHKISINYCAEDEGIVKRTLAAL